MTKYFNCDKIPNRSSREFKLKQDKGYHLIIDQLDQKADNTRDVVFRV